MKVHELIKFLQTQPQDMEVVNERMSDYQIIDVSEWSVVEGVAQDGWVMRSHPTMSEANKEKEKKYLCLSGN